MKKLSLFFKKDFLSLTLLFGALILLSFSSLALYAQTGTLGTSYDWTDNHLNAQVQAGAKILISKQHIEELRSYINQKRIQCQFPTTLTFEDSTLIANQTLIRKVHIDELRSAVKAIYDQAPYYPRAFTGNFTDTIIPNSTPVRAIHIEDLRTALENATCCGDGIKNGAEQCDKLDLGGADTCEDYGLSNGTVSCKSDCNVDTSGCKCPNDQCEPPEEDCNTCPDDCGECIKCGNNICESSNSEQCDGEDFCGKTCADYGWGPVGVGGSIGTLSCGSDCTIDDSTCCGEKVIGCNLFVPGNGRCYPDEEYRIRRSCVDFSETHKCYWVTPECCPDPEETYCGYCGNDICDKFAQETPCTCKNNRDGCLHECGDGCCSGPEDKTNCVDDCCPSNLYETEDISDCGGECSNGLRCPPLQKCRQRTQDDCPDIFECIAEDAETPGSIDCSCPDSSYTVSSLSDCGPVDCIEGLCSESQKCQVSSLSGCPNKYECLDVSSCLCGNGTIDSDEECDGGVPPGTTCQTLGFDGGTVTCKSTCSFNTSGCYKCGDKTCQSSQGETSSNCPGDCCAYSSTWTSIGSCGGWCGHAASLCPPTCNEFQCATHEKCQVRDTGDCNLIYQCQDDYDNCPYCGDGTKNGAEECDGGVPSGTTCQTLGFDSGTVTCKSTCSFNTSNCYKCGDGVKNGTEQCDGSVPSGVTCVTQLGANHGGTLSCTGSCTIDSSGCFVCGVWEPVGCGLTGSGGNACYPDQMLKTRKSCTTGVVEDDCFWDPNCP